MRRTLSAILLVLFALGGDCRLAAYNDNDFDGVEDSKDRCPGSSMEDLVDETGCVPRTGFTLAVGGSSSRGDYGTSDTIDSSTRDLQLSYNKNGWYAGAAASYLESGIDDPVTGTEAQSGMGDTYLSLGYTMLDRSWSLGFQGVLKLPTAEDDIGTGNRDVGGYVSVAGFEAQTTYYATAGYLVTGDDADMTYNDITSLVVGAGKGVGEHLFVSLSAAHAEALLDGMDPSRSVTLFAGYQFNPCWFLNVSFTKGLSDSVADESLFLMAGYAF